MLKIHLKKLVTLLLICVLFNLISTSHGVYAQSAGRLKPIDMMLVLDNSCSMFPRDQIVPGCEVWGNDPEFLRLDGVELFVARLGFAEENEAEYQAGVVSLGETAQMIAPLQPVSESRDAIARLVADPEPQLGTNIMASLQLAYRELRTSSHRRSANLPAVVLLTDGRPYPLAGQSNEEIEELVNANPDIPLFVMLLQDPSDSQYERYVRFWEQMQARYDHIFAYRIQDREQIEKTYNKVVAQLQNTIPGGGGVTVTPENPYTFFVGRCVRQIVLTVLHQSDPTSGTITVQDPNMNDVDLSKSQGIHHFRGTDNSVEVISIKAPRLTNDLKDDFWTLTSDREVRVHLDRQGAYAIHFLEPDVSLTDIANVYLVTERQSPSHEFVMRFDLTDDCHSGESQPLWGSVIHPDGQQESLRIPETVKPDAAGAYEIRFDFASAYPEVLDTPGRFTFILNAGSALSPEEEETDTERVPIATTRLTVDVGRGPYVADVSPEILVCEENQSVSLRVEIGDHALAEADSIRLRAFAAGEEILLQSAEAGVFEGDMSDICTALLDGLACSTEQEDILHLRLAARLLNDASLPPVEQEVPIRVLAPDCPTPTPSPTPVPPPTPVPDTDGDGIRDPVDACPNQPGMVFFDGCPPPWWAWLIGGALALGLLALLILVIFPWVKVRTFAPPPKGYVLVCRNGKPEGPYSVYNAGIAHRANKVTVGEDRKRAHIYIRGLKPQEFYIVQQGDDVKIFDVERGTLKGTFRKAPTSVSTSNSEVRLRVGLDNSRLRC
jgi:hypothetical protein